MLQLVENRNAKTNQNEVSILLNEKAIRALKEEGIIKGLGYVYLAVEIEKAENPNPRICEIDLAEFADRWNLKIIEVRKALIDLDDKRIIISTNSPSIVQLSLELNQ